MKTLSTRREFLGTVAVGAAMLGVTPSVLPARTRLNDGRADRSLELLMLGGTGFLGPHIVRHALARGHRVTLFNRGRTGPALFPDLEHIEGDRYSDLANIKKAVADGRRWDSAIDTFAYVPSAVSDMLEALDGAARHYTVISTTSVYADSNTPDADETAPLAEVDDATAAAIPTHREVGAHYGAMKARCEKAAETGLPGKALSIRPGLIVGPRDTSGRFTYWPVRASEGGTMIAPGTPKDPVQIIDVRDLAEFVVHSIERGLTGAYNAISPARHFTIGSVVESSVRVAGAKTRPEWIDAEFLGRHEVRPWQDMPCWVPPSAPGYAGFGLANCDKAIRAGLKIRTLDETVRATLDYVVTRGPEIAKERGEEFAINWRKQVRGGLDPEKERSVLKAWNERT